MDGQNFMNIPGGNAILYIGLVTFLYYLWLFYANRSVTHKLRAFPTAGSTWPVISTIQFLTNAQHILESGLRKWPGGLFKVPTPIGWWVVVTDAASIAELRLAPDHIISGREANEDTLQATYTLGAEVVSNPYHIPMVRTHLNKALPKLWPQICGEIEEALKEYIPVTDDWTSVKALEISMKVLARSMNRITVGLPLCRDPDWIKLNIVFTQDAAATGFCLPVIPEFVRPLVNHLFSPVHRHRRNGLRLLAPIIAARRKEREEKGNNYEKPVDFLTWLMDEAHGEKDPDLLKRILALNFASVHTTSMTFAHALYYLAVCQEYWGALREEVEEAVNQDGWSKAALDKMHKIDSFIKESQRLHPFGAVMLLRKSVGDFTFSNGVKVPPGVIIAVPDTTHRDPEVFEDPLKFDGFRFVKMKERAVMEGNLSKRFDMVTTNTHSLNFGYGRSACPGRFLAASEIKLMLAYVVVTYDTKFADGVRPSDWSVMHLCGPNRTAEVLFRKRRT